jgi:uncharacterized protein
MLPSTRKGGRRTDLSRRLLLIYLNERHARWGGPVADAIARSGEVRFAISPLVKCECLLGPIARGDPVLERAYLELFEIFLSLAMPEPVYLQAAQLRARFSLKTPDALHLACAQLCPPNRDVTVSAI